MGKHRFRFSDMMPNAWFYKLKDMNKPHKSSSSSSSSSKVPPPLPASPFVPKRASYYFPSPSPSHPKAHDTPAIRPAFELQHNLRPVLTKPLPDRGKDVDEDDERIKKRIRKRANNSPKVRVAVRAHGGARRMRKRGGGLEESYAVVKRSSDPRRDFGESMREMIAENGLTASADLEDLLACYLSLNSDEYHPVIVNAFEEVWFDVANLVTK